MKKQRIISLLLLPFLLLTMRLCAQSIGIKPNFITADERVELLYTVEYLAKSPLVSYHKTMVSWDIDDKFSKYSTHEAVILFQKMEKEYGFAYFRPLNWLLQYSDLPELKKCRTAHDSGELIQSEHVDYLEKFRIALIDFYNKTDFHSFYQTHAIFYEEFLAKVKKSKTLLAIPEYLERFYGTKLYSYQVILSPLMHQGGYNLEFENSANGVEVIAVIGPNGEIEFSPVFDKDFLEKDLMIHEFSHSFVNPLVDQNKELILELEKYYYTDSLKVSAEKEGYSDWVTTFDEILVRANTILITEMNYGAGSAKDLLEYEVKAGFVLIPQVIEIMQEFRQNRSRYRKYDDFLPVLIARLKNGKKLD